jgi:hypothetical protein
MLHRLGKIDFEGIFSSIVVVICGIAWAVAGFPDFTKVALPIIGLSVVVAGGLLLLARHRE